MAGTSTQFSAARFRTAIHAAMAMGTPPDPADQIRFYWNDTRTSAVPVDTEGVPFDPSAVITTTSRASVTRPCAVEYIDANGQPTPFGSVAPSKVRITLLDEDYVVVHDADYVVISGDRYLRLLEPPSYGLYDVGVHQILYVAENEK